MNSNPKQILITGGGGYIGSVLSHKLVELGCAITILDNFQFTKAGIHKIQNMPNVSIINGDLRNNTVVKESLNNIDTVIHLAAISDGRSGKKSPKLTKEINEHAFHHFVDTAKMNGVDRFILASTFGVYGNTYNQPLTEDLLPVPADPYSESKHSGEQILKKFSSEDFSTCSLRIAMVYGYSPRMRFDFIVNSMTIKAITEKKLSVWGGSQRRPQIHIDDVTDYFVHLLNVDRKVIHEKIYNAGGQNPSIMEIVKEIRLFLPETDIEIIQGRQQEDSFELNSDKINMELCLYPKHTIADGIKQIIKHYKEGAWKNINDSVYYN